MKYVKAIVAILLIILVIYLVQPTGLWMQESYLFGLFYFLANFPLIAIPAAVVLILAGSGLLFSSLASKITSQSKWWILLLVTGVILVFVGLIEAYFIWGLQSGFIPDLIERGM